MNKFHISKDGVARSCDAKISCPVGGEDSHFDNYDDAVKASESRNAEKYGNVPAHSKSSPRIKEEFAPHTVENAVSENDLRNIPRDSNNKSFRTYNELRKIRENYFDSNDDVEIEVGLMLEDIAGHNAEDMMSDEGIEANLFDWRGSDSPVVQDAAERVDKLLRR